MADQQLNIRLNAIDNASKAFTEVKNSIFNIRNALIGLGAGVAVRSLINIGREADNLSVRLDQVAKAGYGGSQAFDQLTKFAIDAKIPLLDVFQASNDLLAVSKSPEELAKNLLIASNASAYFKISFVEASDQVAKSLLKGVDSARIFQDRGIRSLRGFGEFADKSFDGVGRALERNFGANGIFGRANQELKEGLGGTLIALDNRFKQFQITIAKGFFETLTRELGNLETFVEKNNEVIDKFAKTLGDILGKAVIVLGNALAFVNRNLDSLIIAIQVFIALKFASVLASWTSAVITFTSALTALSASSGYGLIIKLLTAILGGAGAFYALEKGLKGFNNELEKSNETLDDTSQLLGSIPKTFQEYLSLIKLSNQEQITFLGVLSNIAQKNIDSIANLKKAFNSLEAVSKFIIDNLNKGISAFSRGVAESLVLGKGLEETFRKFAQETLINALSTIIELIIRTYILKSILDALGLPVEKANESSKELRGTSLDIFAINSANYGVQVLTTSEIKKQNDLLREQSSIPRNTGRFRGFDFGNIFDFGIKLLGLAEGGAVRGGMPITVGERGRELFIPQTNGTIIPNHDISKTGSVININVSAVDVKGVEELFINNRATITNIVNQALNSKGRSNLI
jgi:hypothetical protein